MSKIAWTTTTGKAVEVRVSYDTKRHSVVVIANVDGNLVGTDHKADHRTINGIEIGGTVGKLAVPMAKWAEIMSAVDTIKTSPEYTAKSERVEMAEEMDRQYHARAAKLNEED